MSESRSLIIRNIDPDLLAQIDYAARMAGQAREAWLRDQLPRLIITPKGTSNGMVKLAAIREAAELARVHAIVGDGEPLSRRAIEKPMKDFFTSMEASPDSQELALAAAAGMQIGDAFDAERDAAIMRVMRLILEATGGNVIARRREIIAAYVTFFRAAAIGD